MEFNCLPNGPRLGRIRGDLDRAYLELTAMRDALRIERPLTDGESTILAATGAAVSQIRNAIVNLDLSLREINRAEAARNNDD